MMRWLAWTVPFLMTTVALRAQEVQFNRDVRPILSDKCFSCHGPDAKRKAGLRLDTRAGASAELESGSGHAIAAGDPKASVAFERMLHADPEKRMPPASSGKSLTKEQIETLRRWIEQGAKFQDHWAFLPPTRSPLSTAAKSPWVKNPIDAFVLDRLQQEKLKPSPEAKRETLIRRVTLDLTGLPPTPQEVDAFVGDTSPNAYEKVVDRLLASPRFAERMAMQWLDLARYADTNGYNNDEERTMWPWREWVIEAFKANMPYDRFLIEQVAGDLLPNATLQQKLATGFNRNHVITTEGGIVPEEYRVEYVADRVHTTATVFLGLSMQCARCHDHKFDPLTMKDYYGFYAFFNNIEDQTVGYNNGAAARPYIKAPTQAQQAELEKADRDIAALSAKLLARESSLDSDVAAWEKSLKPDDPAWNAPAGLLVHQTLDDPKKVLAIQGNVKGTEGKFAGGLQFNGGHVDLGKVAALERDRPFTISAWFHATGEGALLSKMDEAAAYRGYDLLVETGGKISVHLIHHWPDDALKVITKTGASLNAWHHVAVVYDGSGKAAGVKIHLDGKPTPAETLSDKLKGTLHTEQPLRLGLRTTSLPFKGKLDEVQIYANALPEPALADLANGKTPRGLAELLNIPADKRTAEQKKHLRQWYVTQVDGESAKLRGERTALVARKAELDKSVPMSMVMLEMPTPRKTRLLKRGQFDAPGEEVATEVPGSLPPLKKDAPRNRLGLAQWLVEPNHPLTARVAVNRWWEMLFGTGIVETVEDFGSQGAWPSHPELLDWLATELVRLNWDMKATIKTIVTSATYRQSSAASKELAERDPRNRLLARGPRVRLPAETIRDNALAVSGLLKEKIGGPSVKPYQPAGLWEDVSVERRAIYKADAGEGLYRRSMYTYWKRTCPPPGMTTLDAPDRETCTIRRARTNTPLQALMLLNDPTYLETARKLAERMLTEGGDTTESQLAHGFRLAVSRVPTAEERAVLEQILGRAMDRYQKDAKAAASLLAVGASPRSTTLDPATLAAWTTTASMILNLDEAITKE
ncbi:MAG: DUF1553 domain-containing protein [Gemmataceae bacterium]|nr:DUF1553 domain-containing protein [Gemmataceae bacterium]